MSFVKPTEAELEVLQILWEYGQQSVRFVNEKLNERREVGYTTTLKVLQIMHEKGLVQRDAENRSHLYAAAMPEDATQAHLLHQFVTSTFRGSAASLVMQALGNHSASDAELDEIKALVGEIEKRDKG